MKIKVNNKEIQTNQVYLADLVAELQLPANGIAMAVNNQFVSRTEWKEFLLTDGMQIVVIKAACGG